MCVMSQAVKYKLRAALIGIFGIQMGNLSFFVCIAFGLVTLLATATNAFVILQVVGAGYLLFLGIRILGSTFGRSSTEFSPSRQSSPRGSDLVLQAFAIQVTNPEGTLVRVSIATPIFGSCSPYSVSTRHPMIFTVVVDAAVLTSYACLAERGIRAFRSSGSLRWLERAFGAALVVFGIRLLLWRR